MCDPGFNCGCLIPSLLACVSVNISLSIYDKVNFNNEAVMYSKVKVFYVASLIHS